MKSKVLREQDGLRTYALGFDRGDSVVKELDEPSVDAPHRRVLSVA